MPFVDATATRSESLSFWALWRTVRAVSSRVELPLGIGHPVQEQRFSGARNPNSSATQICACLNSIQDAIEAKVEGRADAVTQCS